MYAAPLRQTVLLTIACLIASLRILLCGIDPLADSRWSLEMLGSEPVIEDRAPTLHFSDGRVGGSAGCNSFQGAYSVSVEMITFNDLAMTLMACPDAQGVMEQERKFFTALQDADRFEISDPHLSLVTTQGKELVFTRQ